jgi:hypothetical protein
MKEAITALTISFEVCLGIFCLIIYGRFSPIADSVMAQMKIPLTAVPPIMPPLIGLVGCILILSIAFKMSLPAPH